MHNSHPDSQQSEHSEHPRRRHPRLRRRPVSDHARSSISRSPLASAIRSRGAAFLAALSAGALLLSGCAAPASTSAANEDDQRLRLAFDTDPQCLDGQQVGNNTALNVARQVTDSLTDQDPKTGKIVPWLAKSWQISKDKKSFTFHLRPGVKFQDGSDFTAASVKENLQGIVKLGAKSSLGSTYLQGLKSVSTPNATTVTANFAQPNAQFLQATSTMTLGMYSHGTLQRTPEQRCTGKIQGTGPFTIRSYTPGDTIALDRNDAYDWPSSQAKHSGPAHLGGIDISIVPESSVRTGSLSAGEVDVDTAVQPQDEELLERSDFQIAARPNPGIVYSFFPNEKNPILADKHVRQAINAALDRDEFSAVLSHHQAPATSAIARSTPGYVEHSKQLAHNPKRAAQLLDQAGWKTNPSTGIREKNGKPLKLSVRYWQTAPFIELVAQQLRESGIDLELKKSTMAETTAAQKSGDIDLDFYNLTRSDPDIVRTVFDAHGRNVNKRAPGKIDALLATSTSTLNPAKRNAAIDEAITHLIDDGDSIPLVELSGVMAHRPGITDFNYDASSRLQLYDTAITGGSGDQQASGNDEASSSSSANDRTSRAQEVHS